MRIERLDHLVLTVADIARTCEFYTRVLGMDVTTFGEGRTALKFGQQKINLHPADKIPVSSPTGRLQARAICASSPLCRLPRSRRISPNARCRSSPGRGRTPALSAQSSRYISATPIRI